MTQRYALPPDRQSSQAQPDVLDQLDKRKEELAAEAAEERRQQAALDAARSEVAVQEAALQDRIDQLLSSSPEDFVIRFLQTEGQ
jgi:FtsZ-binding cell division protein ZapB